MKAYANSPYGQIHYVYKGEGPAIVLIAPSKRSSRVHSDLIDLLAKSYCVVSPDNLGYGNSDPLPDQATIDMLGETVMCCLDELGIRQAYFYGLHRQQDRSVHCNPLARTGAKTCAGRS